MPASSGIRIEATSENTEAFVRALRTRPDRFVLTTDGEPDAWIATDLLVEPQP